LNILNFTFCLLRFFIFLKEAFTLFNIEGEGAFGLVHKALSEDGIQVAIKSFHKDGIEIIRFLFVIFGI
jgi:hypothetical protein